MKVEALFIALSQYLLLLLTYFSARSLTLDTVCIALFVV